MLIEHNGYTQGLSYDLLSVTGAVSLDGLVDVAVLPGFAPQVGDVFTFLTYGSRTGNFASVDSLTDGYTYPSPTTTLPTPSRSPC